MIENRNELDVVKVILDKLSVEFQEILNSDPTFYKGYNLVITNERQFVKSIDRKPKTIFIVVKFLQGNRDYGQQIQPITLNAISEHNTIEVCQKLMMDFSATYNLQLEFVNTSYTMRQTMSTVVTTNSFNEVFDGFRSLFYMTGTFYIGINSNPITSIIVKRVNGEEDEKIDFISSQLTYDGQPDSQPFYGTNNFNRSIVKTGGLSLGFTMYAVNTPFYNQAMDIVFNKDNNVNINKTFEIEISLQSGTKYTINMKLLNVSSVQELRAFPATSFVFAR